MKPLLVSACLAGYNCRFDGTARPHPAIVQLYERGLCIPLCPESLSGLPVPRFPCEQNNGRVILKDGTDVTHAIMHGARLALKRARKSGASIAILKSRSPSCGTGEIYDGSFSGKIVSGMGVFAALLVKAGFAVYSENDFPESLFQLDR